MKTRVLLIVAALMVLLAACQPTRVILSENDPNTIANGGKPVYVTLEQDPSNAKAIIGAILNSVSECPIYSDEKIQKLVGEYGISEEVSLQICDTYKGIQEASLGITTVMLIPAMIEPTVAGEATAGVVFAGGKAVAWVFVKASVPIAIASIVVGDIVADAILSPEAPVWEGPLGIAVEDLASQGAFKDLENEAHHAYKHATTACAKHIANNLPASSAYRSLNSYRIKDPVPDPPSPRLALFYNIGAAMRKLGQNLGPCSTITEDLAREENLKVDKVNLNEWKLMVILGVRPNGDYFTFTSYPVKGIEEKGVMCYWHFTEKIHPEYQLLVCGKGK